MLVFSVRVAAGPWGCRPLHTETRALIFVDDLQYLSLRRIFRQTIEGPSLFFLFRPLSVLSLSHRRHPHRQRGPLLTPRVLFSYSVGRVACRCFAVISALRHFSEEEEIGGDCRLRI